MTFNRLKNIVVGLLTGDNILPEDNEVVLGLLSMAFSEVSTHANAMRLATKNPGERINRYATNGYYFRFPEMPEVLTDELDIDEELCYPTARLLASYVSDKKASFHKQEALRLIREYNSKVAELLTKEESLND